MFPISHPCARLNATYHPSFTAEGTSNNSAQNSSTHKLQIQKHLSLSLSLSLCVSVSQRSGTEISHSVSSYRKLCVSLSYVFLCCLIGWCVWRQEAREATRGGMPEQRVLGYSTVMQASFFVSSWCKQKKASGKETTTTTTTTTAAAAAATKQQRASRQEAEKSKRR